jgi:AcrR family transcriptional regulator
MNKGLETRASIIEKSRELFNRLGWELTIAEISHEIGHGKSQITNHFPKKQDLLYAILEAFDKRLSEVISDSFSLNENYTFKSYFKALDGLLDVMFDYRGVIAYSLFAPKRNEVMLGYLRDRYARNLERLQSRLEVMINNGLLIPTLISKEHAKTFEIQYMNMLSTWFITFELYQGKENYLKLKPELIKAILSIFTPYLTELGKSELTATFLLIDAELGSV